MQFERTKTSATVVLVGVFDPSAFLLEKLVDAALLAPADLKAARCEELLPGQLLTLRFGQWGRLNVLPGRWTFDIFEPPFIRACDFALRCIRELAPSSTVRAMGLNSSADFKFLDATQRDALGRRLVPAVAWGRWGRELARRMDEIPATEAGHPGALSAAMREPRPRGREHGYLDIRWEAFVSRSRPSAWCRSTARKGWMRATQRATADSRVGTVSLTVCRPSSCM